MQPSTLYKTADSGANAAVDVTLEAISGRAICVTALEVAVGGAAIGAADVSVTVKSGTEVLFKTILGSGAARGTRIARTFPGGLKGISGEAVTLSIEAGGAAVVITGSLAGFPLR